MKWLNSLDELLYEVMSWLLFFPLTLCRALFRPFEIMSAVEREAALPNEQQYAASISPPLFLALVLLLAHTVSTAMGQTDRIIANNHGLGALVSDNASALALRVIIFAAFPLFLGARLVRHRGIKLDRGSLRQPFYAQCYPTAVFALGFSVGTSFGLDHHPWIRITGHWLVVASIVNFWVIESRWFARVLAVSYPRAAGNVMLGLLEGATFLVAVAFLFTR